MIINDKIKVAALPIDIASGDKTANIKKAKAAISSLPKDVDIAILPELFSTAFIPDKKVCERLAETNDGHTMHAIKEIAIDRCMGIAGSFLAKEGETLFNRAFFVEPNGECHFYDKRHTFSMGQESESIDRGGKPSPIIRFRGWNISLAVCYDIRFPAWCRNRNLAYDLLIVPANWAAKRATAWSSLLKARAIENLAYVVGANRSGSDEFGDYDGQTYIFDYKGGDIGVGEGQGIVAELSMYQLDKFRNAFPVWKDADNFVIEY